MKKFPSNRGSSVQSLTDFFLEIPDIVRVCVEYGGKDHTGQYEIEVLK